MRIPITSFSFRRCGPYTMCGTNYSLLALARHPIKVTFPVVNRCDAASKLCVQSDVLLLHCGQSSLIFLQQIARKILLLDVHIVARCMSCECQDLQLPVQWNSYSVCLFVCLFVCCLTASVLKNYLTTVWSGKLTRIKFNWVVLKVNVFHVRMEKYDEIEIQLGKNLRK